MSARLLPGDMVVYCKQKSSVHPGPHARDIQPAPRGESYSYSVDKFWRVIGVRHDNTVVVLTRRGKQHTITADDPALRQPHWWERLLFRHRFPPWTLAE